MAPHIVRCVNECASQYLPWGTSEGNTAPKKDALVVIPEWIICQVKSGNSEKYGMRKPKWALHIRTFKGFGMNSSANLSHRSKNKDICIAKIEITPEHTGTHQNTPEHTVCTSESRLV